VFEAVAGGQETDQGPGIILSQEQGAIPGGIALMPGIAVFKGDEFDGRFPFAQGFPDLPEAGLCGGQHPKGGISPLPELVHPLLDLFTKAIFPVLQEGWVLFALGGGLCQQFFQNGTDSLFFHG